jgi:hypothetical protein
LFLQEDDAIEHQLGLSGQGLDDLFYSILLDLISGLADMNLRDHSRSSPFR